MIFACAPEAGPSRASAESAAIFFMSTAALNTPRRRRVRSAGPPPRSSTTARLTSATAARATSLWRAGITATGGASARSALEDLLEHAERRARLSAARHEARVPRLRVRARVPLVEVDAGDTRAQARDGAQDEARDLRRVGRALRQRDRGLVVARDETAGLGQPDLALGRLQQRGDGLGLQAVGADVVVQPPVARLAGDLDEAPHPLGDARQIQQVGAEDVTARAGVLERQVVARVELGLEADPVGLV